MDPSGQFAYASSGGFPTSALGAPAAGAVGRGLFAYTIDATSGALTEVGGSTSLYVAGAVITDPFGRFVYALDGDNIYAFTIDSTTGALTAVAGNPIAFPSATSSMAIEPTGHFAYITGLSGIYIYSIDASTGRLTHVGSPVAVQLAAGARLQIDPSGQFVYVSPGYTSAPSQGIYAYTMDSTTGALTLVPGSPFATGAIRRSWQSSTKEVRCSARLRRRCRMRRLCVQSLNALSADRGIGTSRRSSPASRHKRPRGSKFALVSDSYEADSRSGRRSQFAAPGLRGVLPETAVADASARAVGRSGRVPVSAVPVPALVRRASVDRARAIDPRGRQHREIRR